MKTEPEPTRARRRSIAAIVMGLLIGSRRTAPSQVGPVLLAAGAATLFSVFVVVEGSHRAYDVPPRLEGNGLGVPLPGHTRRFGAGDVVINDDDAGQSLFDLTALAPGQQVQNCIAVTYRGTVRHPSVHLAVRASGALAPKLATQVEVGVGGRFGDCAEFAATRTLYQGTLAGLADRYSPGAGGLAAFEPTASSQSATFRFTFALTDDVAAQGLASSASFLWTANG